MKEQEIQTILKDQQDILVQMNDRLHQIEKQQSETKDYSAELAHISGQLEHLLADDMLIGLKESISNEIATLSAVIMEVKEQQVEQGKLISETPKRMKLNVEHRLTGRQRPYVIIGTVLLLVSVFSLFASIQLWRVNSALHDSDIKIRMVRLLYPQVSLDMDSTYSNSPKELKMWVKQEEERLMAIKKAEESAKQSKEQAERAKEELQRLKERKYDSLK